MPSVTCGTNVSLSFGPQRVLTKPDDFATVQALQSLAHATITSFLYVMTGILELRTVNLSNQGFVGRIVVLMCARPALYVSCSGLYYCKLKAYANEVTYLNVLQDVILSLLKHCQTYVVKKQSNLTKWHPVLGWFMQTDDTRYAFGCFTGFVRMNLKN